MSPSLWYGESAETLAARARDGRQPAGAPRDLARDRRARARDEQRREAQRAEDQQHDRGVIELAERVQARLSAARGRARMGIGGLDVEQRHQDEQEAHVG